MDTPPTTGEPADEADLIRWGGDGGFVPDDPPPDDHHPVERSRP